MRYKIFFRKNKHESWTETNWFENAFYMKEYLVALENIPRIEFKLIREELKKSLEVKE